MSNPPEIRPPEPDGHAAPRPNMRAEARLRLEHLRPGEPDEAARARIWSRVAAAVDDPDLAAVPWLKSLAPAAPTAAARDRIWRRVQAGLEGSAVPATRPWPRLPGLRQAALAATLVVVLLAGTISGIAQAALPGTPLYPVKRGWEAVQWQLTPAPEGRARLALTLADRRRAEAEALVARGGAPSLVEQALAEALSNFDQAAGHLPPAMVAAHVDGWQAEVAAWPPEYQAGASGTLDAWLRARPDLDPPPDDAAPATPTSTPGGPTPTAAGPVFSATPPIELPGGGTAGAEATPTALNLPVATATPSLTVPAVVPSATATPGLPLPTLPVLPSATPDSTATPTPSAGATATPAPSATPTATPLLALPTTTPLLPPLEPSSTPTPTASGSPSPTPTATATPLIALPTLTLP